MTERFPEQRNRSSSVPRGRSEPPAADSGFADELEHTVFDESFVHDAPVRELSAHSRELHARWMREPLRGLQVRGGRGGPGGVDGADGPQAVRWSVRPSHKLASVRLPVVAWIVCAVTAVVLLSMVV